MSLTPIHVRGKRKRKDLEQTLSPSPSISQSGERSALSSRSNTPSTSATSRTSRSRSSAPKRRKRQAHLSLLEQLPTELLHQIFFYTLNLSLPRSSLCLASKLSSEHVYTKLVFLAFPGSGDKTSHDIEENRAMTVLQTDILKCRWMTLPFFRKCRAIYQEKWRIIIEKGGQPRLPELTDRHTGALTVWPTCMFMAYSYDEELEDYDESDDHIFLSFAPEKLLHGPWTDEKVEFLAELEDAFAGIGSAYSTDNEIMLEGLREAILVGREDAVKLLLCQTSTAFAAGVETPLLRLAVLEGECNKNIVETLIKRFPCTDCGDAALWAWAAQNGNGPDDIGTWLRNSLEKGMMRSVSLSKSQD